MSIFFHLFNHLISWVMPKSRDIWIYGEWFGERFCDNSSYAFNASSNRQIKKIWVTKNYEIVQKVRAEGKLCYHSHSFKGLYFQARAKVFFCSVNSKDFCFSSLTPRVIIFQLWHGLPLKKIGFDVVGRGSIKWLLDVVRSKLFDKYSFIISPSADFDKLFCSAFNVSSQRILRSLYPRCDGLFVGDNVKSSTRMALGVATKHVVFYLPTHRNEGRTPDKLSNLIESIKGLNDFLVLADITLIVKPHFYEAKNFQSGVFGNVLVLSDLPADLYTCLSMSSALITDYSSVALDYAVTNKPIFYYAPDLEDYVENDREGYFDYGEILQEYYVSSQGLGEALERFFIKGIRPKPISLSIPGASSGLSISEKFQFIAESIVYGKD